MKNPLTNTRIEYHILQSFPVTCLNRDDVGSPKTALIGGVTRARVSSQCWKRQVRLALQDLGIKLGIRTKKLVSLLQDACLKQGAPEEQATACSNKMAELISDDTLVFITETEANLLANYVKELNFDDSKIKDKELTKHIKKALDPTINGLDIALFGRMVAKAADMNIEAAASFSHAISTHKVSNEIDFFTALDDLQSEEETGSSHMGTLEFNSATYYRYISLDLGQLAQTFGVEDISEISNQIKTAIEAFTKALYIAIPSARQTTQAGACPWDFAKILVRKGQGLQIPFETPIKRETTGGYLQPSIQHLKKELANKEQMTGSLFGKIAEYEWGEDTNYSIDQLIQDLQTHVR